MRHPQVYEVMGCSVEITPLFFYSDSPPAVQGGKRQLRGLLSYLLTYETFMNLCH